MGVLLFAVPLGLAIGVAGAIKPGGFADRLGNVVALLGISIVHFWLGLTLILLIAVPFDSIPTGGASLPNAIILPAITAGFRPMGRLAQFIRSALLEEFGKPYVEMARAQGLSEVRVFGHVAKNAALPVLTLFGDELISLMGGVMVVEIVFAWPGVGRLIVRSVEARDLFVLEAALFVLISIVILGNFLIDMAYATLNPKVRYGSA